MSDWDIQQTTVAMIDWWYIVRDFKTPEAAKDAFVRVNEDAAKMSGEAMLAGYRVLDSFDQQGVNVGVPRRLVILGNIEQPMRDAAKLAGGTPVIWAEHMVRGLVARRIRYLANAEELGMPPGVFTHHYEHGQMVHPDGTVTPQTGEEE